jgi:hypothetical protein
MQIKKKKKRIPGSTLVATTDIKMENIGGAISYIFAKRLLSLEHKLGHVGFVAD